MRILNLMRGEQSDTEPVKRVEYQLSTHGDGDLNLHAYTDTVHTLLWINEKGELTLSPTHWEKAEYEGKFRLKEGSL